MRFRQLADEFNCTCLAGRQAFSAFSKNVKFAVAIKKGATCVTPFFLAHQLILGSNEPSDFLLVLFFFNSK
jgi:hypothetical protein